MEERRPLGRPRGRWIDAVDKDYVKEARMREGRQRTEMLGGGELKWSRPRLGCSAIGIIIFTAPYVVVAWCSGTGCHVVRFINV